MSIDAFTWSYQDIPELETNIVSYKLPLKKRYRSKKPKLRRIRLEIFLKIQEEVKKQFKAGFLDVLVGNTTKHFIISFMDSFSGYNQIKIALVDKEKTMFITP